MSLIRSAIGFVMDIGDLWFLSEKSTFLVSSNSFGKGLLYTRKDFFSLAADYFLLETPPIEKRIENILAELPLLYVYPFLYFVCR